MTPPIQKNSNPVLSATAVEEDFEPVEDGPLQESFWRRRLAPLDPFFQEKLVFYTNFARDLISSHENHQFGFDNPSSYSLQTTFHWGFKDFHNGAGLDYSGPGGRVAAGLRFNLGETSKHAIYLRGFYDFQNLSREDQEVWTHSIGLESSALLGVIPDWFNLGPTLALGGVRYASDGNILFNQGPGLRALDSSGVRLELGGQTCTWGSKICLGAKWVMDTGMQSGLEAFSNSGLNVTAGIDLMRFWDKPNPRVIMARAEKDADELDRQTIAKLKKMIVSYSDAQILDFIKDTPENRWAFTRPSAEFKSASFDSTDAALSKFRETTPQVLMFGEVHTRSDYKGASCLQKFVHEVLPALNGKYTHLVIEHIPYDIPEAELDYFRQTGRWEDEATPLLRIYLKALGPTLQKEISELLQTCRKLGSQVHGGGIALEEFIKGWKDATGMDIVLGAMSINDHTLPKIREWAQQGKRVITYHGAAHNNMETEFAGDRIMDLIRFGDTIKREFSAAEIDLIVPEAFIDGIRRGSWEGYAVPGMLKAYLPHLPKSGKVSLIERSADSFALAYPL